MPPAVRLAGAMNPLPSVRWLWGPPKKITLGLSSRLHPPAASRRVPGRKEDAGRRRGRPALQSPARRPAKGPPARRQKGAFLPDGLLPGCKRGRKGGGCELGGRELHKRWKPPRRSIPAADACQGIARVLPAYITSAFKPLPTSRPPDIPVQARTSQTSEPGLPPPAKDTPRGSSVEVRALGLWSWDRNPSPTSSRTDSGASAHRQSKHGTQHHGRFGRAGRVFVVAG